jgi:hypothetical protein
LDLSIRGGLQPVVSSDGRNVAFTDAHGGTSLNYNGLTVFDAGGKTLTAKWASIGGDRLRLQVEDAGAHYPLTIDPLVQQAYLKASNANQNDRFGAAAAVSGDTVVVGALDEDSSATGVNGNGANNSVEGSGAAYVFVRSGGVWSQQAYLKASNCGFGDHFGAAVAISGDTLVVGAHSERSSAAGVNGDQTDNSALASGAAYVFVRSGGVWTQQAYLKASNPGPFDLFGVSVAVGNDTVVVGASSESSNATGVNGDDADNSASGAGAAYVFVRSGGVWSQQAYLKASNTEANDHFGASVAISGDTVAVGAYWEDSSATGVNGDQTNNSGWGSGAAYVFVRSGGMWSQQAYLKPSSGQFDTLFGYSLALSGETLVVGAYQEDTLAVDAGAAYVFVRSGDIWSQEAHLQASHPDALDYFGFSVAVSGDTAVIGARWEDSNATGLNGNEADNSAQDSGAAFVFARSGGVWSQYAYLKASNADAGDRFSQSVAVSGETVVVGALAEDSNATGVNGNQANNSALSSGAAYVFTVPRPVVYCPAGVSANGCTATIGWSGSPSVSSTSGFTIDVANVERNRQGVLFYGLSGRTLSAWGVPPVGFLCVKAPTQRMSVHNSGGASGVCTGTLSEDWLAFLSSHPGALGQPIAPGTTVNIQAWYRDSLSAKTTNLSNALEFVTAP